jgi:hypothetical protein
MNIFPRTNFGFSGTAKDGISIGSIVLVEETLVADSVEKGLAGRSMIGEQAIKVNNARNNRI